MSYLHSRYYSTSWNKIRYNVLVLPKYEVYLTITTNRKPKRLILLRNDDKLPIAEITVGETIDKYRKFTGKLIVSPIPLAGKVASYLGMKDDKILIRPLSLHEIADRLSFSEQSRSSLNSLSIRIGEYHERAEPILLDLLEFLLKYHGVRKITIRQLKINFGPIITALEIDKNKFIAELPYFETIEYADLMEHADSLSMYKISYEDEFGSSYIDKTNIVAQVTFFLNIPTPTTIRITKTVYHKPDYRYKDYEVSETQVIELYM